MDTSTNYYKAVYLNGNSSASANFTQLPLGNYTVLIYGLETTDISFLRKEPDIFTVVDVGINSNSFKNSSNPSKNKFLILVYVSVLINMAHERIT